MNKRLNIPLRTFTALTLAAITSTVIHAQEEYKAVVLSDNPVHYWPLQETDATAGAADEGTEGWALGTFMGGFTLGVDTDPFRLGNAVRLDGIEESESLIGLGLFHPGDSITVEAWAYLDLDARPESWHAIVARWDGSYELDIGPNGHANFFFRNHEDTFGGVSSAQPVPRGQWNHFVGIFDAVAGEATIYVNGVQGSIVTMDGALGTLQNAGYAFNDRVLIGATRNGFVPGQSFNWKGMITQVAVYNYGLEAERMRAHFNAGVPDEVPTLAISSSVFLLWPAFPADLVLEARRKSETAWERVTATPTQVGAEFQVVVSSEEASQHDYRVVRSQN